MSDALPEDKRAIRIATSRDNNFTVNFFIIYYTPQKLTTVDMFPTKTNTCSCSAHLLSVSARSLHIFSFCRICAPQVFHDRQKLFIFSKQNVQVKKVTQPAFTS